MFTTAYVVDMPGGEPEAALVGIGEPSAWALMDDDQKLADERVFYYFDSLAEIELEHRGWAPDTWFTVEGLELPCSLCGMLPDAGTVPLTVAVDGPDNAGEPPIMDTLLLCPSCR
jgi:hypothetical protein